MLWGGPTTSTGRVRGGATAFGRGGGRGGGLRGAADHRARRFHSEIRDTLKGRTQALEDPAVELSARGLSLQDIEDAFRDESGWSLPSRTAVSEVGKQLWADYY